MEGFLRLLQRAQNPLLHLLAAPVLFWEVFENGWVQVPEGKKKLTYCLLVGKIILIYEIAVIVGRHSSQNKPVE